MKNKILSITLIAVSLWGIQTGMENNPVQAAVKRFTGVPATYEQCLRTRPDIKAPAPAECEYSISTNKTNGARTKRFLTCLARSHAQYQELPGAHCRYIFNAGNRDKRRILECTKNGYHFYPGIPDNCQLQFQKP